MPEFEEWRASLNPLVVDVVGDFAGRGVFAIHGEALITHCLTNARVYLDCEYSSPAPRPSVSFSRRPAD